MNGSVVIVPYEPAWPQRYAAEQALLAAAFLAAAVDIQHIGSTAVPGLAAKPVIDILAGVRSLPPAPELVTALERLGYEHRGEAGIPGRHFFRKGEPRSHHLHVAIHGGEFWEKHILFRDYLRAHPGAARAYAELKQALAARFAEDREKYTERKGPFINALLARAQAWRQR